MTNGVSDGIDQGIEQGIQQGIDQGIKQKQIDMVSKMLNEKIDILTISKVSGLSIEDIKKLSN